MIQEIISYSIFFLLVISGFVFLVLIWWLPYHFEQIRVQEGNEGARAEFNSGSQSLNEATNSLITAFSIFSAIATALIILPFSENKSLVSILLSVTTLIVFFSGIIWSLYLSLRRPFTGYAQNLKEVYFSLRLLFLGMSLTMLTLATSISL